MEKHGKAWKNLKKYRKNFEKLEKRKRIRKNIEKHGKSWKQLTDEHLQTFFGMLY